MGIGKIQKSNTPRLALIFVAYGLSTSLTGCNEQSTQLDPVSSSANQDSLSLAANGTTQNPKSKDKSKTESPATKEDEHSDSTVSKGDKKSDPEKESVSHEGLSKELTTESSHDDDDPENKGKCGGGSEATPPCTGTQILVTETWDAFNPNLWNGDGDQIIVGGFFSAREGARSATADWIHPSSVLVDTLRSVRFSNRVQLQTNSEKDFAESGALFLIDSDTSLALTDYVFVNVGYTKAPSHVFVESFGSTGGIDFDQFEETTLPYQNELNFDLDLWISPARYQIAVNGEMQDTVTLTKRLSHLDLFEVGVQKNSGSLGGRVDQTTISTLCANTPSGHPREHETHRAHRRERLDSNCLTRNHYIRLAKEKIKNTRHPARGLRLLANLKENREDD